LKPGEKREIEIELGVLACAEEIESFAKKVSSITGGVRPMCMKSHLNKPALTPNAQTLAKREAQARTPRKRAYLPLLSARSPYGGKFLLMPTIHNIMGRMSYVVVVDDRGRILLPVDVRKRLGLKRGSKLVLRILEDERLEAVPLEKELEKVADAFKRKFAGWREEDHEATATLLKMVKGSGDR
jgi:AbrB family looped-hinge helix DNA binding protein